MSWRTVTSPATETLVLESKNILIWESNTIHPLVSMVWTFMSSWPVQDTTSVTDVRSRARLVLPTNLWRVTVCDGSKPDLMESSFQERNKLTSYLFRLFIDLLIKRDIFQNINSKLLFLWLQLCNLLNFRRLARSLISW